jgi:hypothetical protein
MATQSAEALGAMVVLEKGRGRAVGPHRQSSERVHTAYHEAGHAVVAAEALGIGAVKRVSMVATDTTCGHVVHKLPRWISDAGYDMTPSQEAACIGTSWYVLGAPQPSPSAPAAAHGMALSPIGRRSRAWPITPRVVPTKPSPS